MIRWDSLTYFSVHAGSSRHCTTHKQQRLPPTGGFLASALVTDRGFGSSRCPWVITAQSGQRINITLHNYARMSSSTLPSKNYCLLFPHVTLLGIILKPLLKYYCSGSLLVNVVKTLRLHWKKKVEPKRLQAGAVFMSTGWPPLRYRFSTTQTWSLRKKWLHF